MNLSTSAFARRLPAASGIATARVRAVPLAPPGAPFPGLPSAKRTGASGNGHLTAEWRDCQTRVNREMHEADAKSPAFRRKRDRFAWRSVEITEA
jgi:hypothetical protein